MRRFFSSFSHGHRTSLSARAAERVARAHYHRSPLVNPVNSVNVWGAAGVDRYAETRLVCVERFGVYVV